MIFWCYNDTQLVSFMSRSSDPDKLVERINKKYADEYHLTPEEMEKIRPLTKEMGQHIYQVRHQFGVDIISTLDDYHAQIAAQLTPEHRSAYEAAMAVRKKKLSAVLLTDPGSPTPASK